MIITIGLWASYLDDYLATNHFWSPFKTRTGHAGPIQPGAPYRLEQVMVNTLVLLWLKK